jgi:hypothetical protein
MGREVHGVDILSPSGVVIATTQIHTRNGKCSQSPLLIGCISVPFWEGISLPQLVRTIREETPPFIRQLR